MSFALDPLAHGPYGGGLAGPAAAPAERILFVSPRAIDRATLTASSEKGTLVVANLQNRQPQKKWRSNSAPAQHLICTLASAVACNALAMSAHGFSSAGLVRVRGAAAAEDVVSDPGADSGWQSVWASGTMPTDEEWPAWLSLVRWSNDSAFHHWRIDFLDPMADYIEIGRLALGRAFQPSRNVDLNLRKAFDPPDIQTRTAFGFTYPDDRGSKPRSFVLPFSGASEADLTALGDIQRLAGLAGDIFVSIDPAKTADFHRYSMHGLFAAGGAYEAQPLWDEIGQVWALSLTITELL